MSQQQQCSVSHQHLYKKKNVDWKNDLRQKFMLRLRDDRQRAFNHARGRFGHVRTDLLLKSIIWHEINALKLSDHVTNDELNEAIQEFERFQDEIAQQEIESMITYERERLEDLANADNSVLCPRCQFANLNFPDEYTLNCERCKLQARLTQPLPSPLELMIYFTKIFTSHADRECSETPTLIVQDIDKLFLRCNRCAFDFKIF
uniref:RPA-interacting protein C-terminal domain-containing protein n=1 Tax=Onchocerca volvulus TaxID=6282 RepID=A0A8R1TZA9_ONCVO